MTPKISIVIPVYNVEPYLRQCLDSVVNQTLRDIQIICVNDGSTDGSRQILQEYADHDSRIEIVDKPNGGLSSARNAAYPHIKGKYTQFVDSDDWIDLDACRKVFLRAEQSGADVVVFEFEGVAKQHKRTMISAQTQNTSIVDDGGKKRFLDVAYPAVWSKFYRSSFWLDYNIHSPDGSDSGEDGVLTWKAVTQANKIVFLPEVLYYYRLGRIGAITSQKSLKNLASIITNFGVIKHFLIEKCLYDVYSIEYHRWKIDHVYDNYLLIDRKNEQSAAETLIKDSLDTEDIAFLPYLKSKSIHDFFLALLGDTKAKRRNLWRSLWRSFNNLVLRPVIKPIESVVRFITGKKKKRKASQQERQIAQLSELVSQLCEEVIELRREKSVATTKRAA